MNHSTNVVDIRSARPRAKAISNAEIAALVNEVNNAILSYTAKMVTKMGQIEELLGKQVESR